MNTTTLLRRIDKYCRINSGGRYQTGETKFLKDVGVHIGVIKCLRNGGEPRADTLNKMDEFLREKGY